MTLSPTTAVVRSGNPPGAEITIDVAGGGAPDGDVQLVVDGEVVETRKARRTTWIGAPTESLGEHTVTARYLGSTTQAPSETETPATYTVTKADTAVVLYRDDQFETTPDDFIPFEVLPQDSGADLTEPVTVSEGGAVLAEIPLDSYFGELPLADLPLGTHTLSFDYPGDVSAHASHATITFTIVEVQAMVELSIALDREVVHYGSGPIKATVDVRQTTGDPIDLTGDISFYLDDELITTRPSGHAPATVEIPVGDLGDHRVRATMESTDAYVVSEAWWPFHVVKAPTRIEVDTSHPYHRSDVVDIAVLSDGPVSRGRVFLRSGETGIDFDVVDGKAKLPLKLWGRGLGRHTLDLEYVDYGDDSLFERSVATAQITVVPKVGDTSIVASVDRARPVVGTTPGKATVTVRVEGGAAPDGVLEYHSYWGGEPIVVDAASGPVTLDLPTTLVGESGFVTFVPSGPDQEGSTVPLDYLVGKAKTATRVTAPTTPIDTSSRLPVSVDVLDSPIAPHGRVLVTDGAPDCDYDEVYGEFELPTCSNDFAVVELDDGELDLTGLATGQHNLVFWYLPLPMPGAPEFGPGAGARTEPSRTTVPVTITEAPGTGLSLDRESTVVGGEAVTATAAIDGDADPEGEIAFFVDDKQYAVHPAGVEPVTLSLPVDAVGAHQITASYTGSQRGEGPRSAAVGFTVAKATTSTTIAPVVGGGQGVLEVSVAAIDSTVVPSGRVQVVEGTTTLAFVDLSGGVGRFTPHRMRGGDHSLTFRYVGDPRTEPSSAARRLRLPAVATTTRLTLDRTRSAWGSPTVLAAEVASTDGVPATGTVIFLVDGRQVATAPLAHGRARSEVRTMRVGRHAVTARLVDSDAYRTSTSAAQEVVVTRAPAAIRATVRHLRAGRLRVVATVSSSTLVAGKVRVLQKVRTTRAQSRPRVRLVRVAATRIRRTGNVVTVVLRTKQLRGPARRVVLQYTGSATVEATARTVRVPRRG